MNLKIGKPTDTANVSGSKSSGKMKHKSPVVNKKIFTPPGQVKTEIYKELELLGKTLKLPSLAKIKGLDKILPPLNEIVSLLGQSSLDPFDGDVLLMEKFITSWIKKYGGLLPEIQKKELNVVKNLLGSRRLEESDDNKIIFGNGSEAQEDRIRWKVDFHREKESADTSAEDEKVFCVLNLFCINLGDIKVSLQGEKEQLRCIFFSDRKGSRQIIRKSLPQFRDHLIKARLKVPFFRISRKKKTTTAITEKSVKRVRLWG